MPSSQSETFAAREASIIVEAFYRYGYRGKPMLAIRAPFAMGSDGAELIGHAIEADGRRYVVRAIARQISGPIVKGEPIGVEVRDATAAD